jgi:hypothetical protein
MDEDQFWEIINLSVLQSANEQEQITNIQQQLIALGPDEVVKFELRMQMLLYYSYTSKLLCAGELLHRHCGSYGFEQFRCWLILQGRTVFYLSVQDPDSLEVEYTVSRYCFEANALYTLPSSIFRRVYNDDLMNHVEFDKFPFYEDNYPRLKYSWRADRPKTMERICPDLYDACY